MGTEIGKEREKKNIEERARERERERETDIYICVYIYAGELLVSPPFGLQRVISLATLRVISLSTFWGAIFAL